KLCLTLAHQGIGQIKDSCLRSAMRGVSTFLFFRLDEETAKFFKSEIKHYDDYNLQWLHVGEAVYRAANGFTTLVHTPAPPPYSENSFAEIIRKRTIDLYSCALSKDVL